MLEAALRRITDLDAVRTSHADVANVLGRALDIARAALEGR